MSSAILFFKVGAIGLCAVLFGTWFCYEFIFIKEVNPEVVIEEPFGFEFGVMTLVVIFFRMMWNGAEALGLVKIKRWNINLRKRLKVLKLQKS